LWQNIQPLLEDDTPKEKIPEEVLVRYSLLTSVAKKTPWAVGTTKVFFLRLFLLGIFTQTQFLLSFGKFR
jgi:hypothetical protein